MPNDVIELAYPAKIEVDDDGYLVTFRDLENVFTQGETYEEAIISRSGSFRFNVTGSTRKRRHNTFATSPQVTEIRISPSPEVTAPVLLHLLRQINHRSMADVARAMGVPYQVNKNGI